MKYTAPDHEVFHCPRCGKQNYDKSLLGDFVIPGRYGPASRSSDECDYCEGKFVCERNSDETITVKAQ